MIRKKHGMIFLFLNIIFMLGISAEVVTAENIDPDNDDSQYAYGENVGYLNFEPGGNGGSGAVVTNSSVTGYVWGENIGWLNLSPASYGGVANDGAGNLSGYAWGENVGWINFAPTGGGVTIGADGVFDGWAWGENIGWIHLKNLAIPYKVKTAWTPSSTAVSLVAFGAMVNDDGSVTLTWETASEADTVGFNLYRASRKDRAYEQINGSLIESSGDAVSGNNYSYDDAPGKGSFYYKLEDVDNYGVKTQYEPVKVRIKK